MRAEFVRSQAELPDVVSFWFKPQAGFSYQAGDYTELSLGLAGIADRRWLSLASAPFESKLQFTVKIGNPASPFKQALQNLKKGQIVYLSPPMGNFNAPDRPDKLLFLAGGVGITPFRSLGLQEKHRPVGHDIQLLYAARAKQYLFDTELATAGLSVTKLTSPGEILSLDTIGNIVPDFSQRFVYLAGPEPMMSRLHEELLDNGHARWRLRLCYFPGYLAI